MPIDLAGRGALAIEHAVAVAHADTDRAADLFAGDIGVRPALIFEHLLDQLGEPLGGLAEEVRRGGEDRVLVEGVVLVGRSESGATGKQEEPG